MVNFTGKYKKNFNVIKNKIINKVYNDGLQLRFKSKI